jgi:hypothetical protein
MSEYTENEIKLALNEAVEQGLLKTVFIDGEIKYVNPGWQKPEKQEASNE